MEKPVTVAVASTPCEAGGVTVERSGELATARPTLSIADCPSCGGTGLVDSPIVEGGKRYPAVGPCPRARLRRKTTLFNEARLPAVHAASTFDRYQPRREGQGKAFDVARNFALRYPANRGFIVAGPPGTGKTHLLAAAIRHLTLELGVKCGYVELSLLYAQIRRGFQEGKSGGEIIQPLSQLEVLAIDELGKGRGSAFELETLDELIARRYNAGKITLFATNYSLKAPEERSQQRGYTDTAAAIEASKDSRLLSDRVGDRIYSRLCELCEFVELAPNTPDFRRDPPGPRR